MKKSPAVTPEVKVEYTAEQKIERALNRINEQLDQDLASCQANISDFANSILPGGNSSVNPSYAFSACSDAFLSAAKLSVANEIKYIIREHGLIKALEIATEKTLSCAKDPSFSTSPTSNLMSVFVSQSWARYQETLTWRVASVNE